MVKQCKVLINNEAVTVINFDGREVQIPAIKRNVDSVNILFKNNQYIVVGDDYKEKKEEAVKEVKKQPYQKPAFKKTTIEKKTHKKKW